MAMTVQACAKTHLPHPQGVAASLVTAKMVPALAAMPAHRAGEARAMVAATVLSAEIALQHLGKTPLAWAIRPSVPNVML